MWLVILSDQLRIVALVGHYPPNQLIRHKALLELLPYRRISALAAMPGRVCGLTLGFPRLSPTLGQVPYVLLTRPPLSPIPKNRRPFDLHVLGAPPAFVLSQDQTLHYSVGPKTRTMHRAKFRLCSHACISEPGP